MDGPCDPRLPDRGGGFCSPRMCQAPVNGIHIVGIDCTVSFRSAPMFREWVSFRGDFIFDCTVNFLYSHTALPIIITKTADSTARGGVGDWRHAPLYHGLSSRRCPYFPGHLYFIAMPWPGPDQQHPFKKTMGTWLASLVPSVNAGQCGRKQSHYYHIS